MRLCILAVGHKLPEWVAKGCAEYIKRMPRELALSVSEIKPEPRGSKSREQLLAEAGIDAAGIRASTLARWPQLLANAPLSAAS